MLPDGWKTVAIRQLGSVNSNTLAENTAPNYEFRYLDLSAVKRGVIEFPQTTIPFADAPSRARRILKRGDVIMATVRPLLQGFAYAEFDTQDIICSTGFAIISPHISSDGPFIYQSLYSHNVCRQLFGLLVGSNYPAINASDVRSLKLHIPESQGERAEIAAILLTWDRAIDQVQRLIDAKTRLKKGLMQQLLVPRHRADGTASRTQKECRIGELLKEVKRDISCEDDELYHLISVRRRSGGLFHRESLRGKDILTKSLKTARAGDFLISKMQVVHGATGLVTAEFDGMTISDSYIALVPRDDKKLDIEYFSYLSQMPFMYHLTYLASYGVHIEKMTFNLSLWLRSRILIPTDIKEQRRIVSTLNSICGEIQLLTRYNDLLQQQKRGLMQLLLTGKVRVQGSSK